MFDFDDLDEKEETAQPEKALAAEPAPNGAEGAPAVEGRAPPSPAKEAPPVKEGPPAAESPAPAEEASPAEVAAPAAASTAGRGETGAPPEAVKPAVASPEPAKQGAAATAAPIAAKPAQAPAARGVLGGPQEAFKPTIASPASFERENPFATAPTAARPAQSPAAEADKRAPEERPNARFREGDVVKTLGTAIMRRLQDVSDSNNPKIRQLEPDEKLTVLEVGTDAVRKRLRVACGDAAVGWISVVNDAGRDLIALVRKGEEPSELFTGAGRTLGGSAGGAEAAAAAPPSDPRAAALAAAERREAAARSQRIADGGLRKFVRDRAREEQQQQQQKTPPKTQFEPPPRQQQQAQGAPAAAGAAHPASPSTSKGPRPLHPSAAEVLERVRQDQQLPRWQAISRRAGSAEQILSDLLWDATVSAAVALDSRLEAALRDVLCPSLVGTDEELEARARNMGLDDSHLREVHSLREMGFDYGEALRAYVLAERDITDAANLIFADPQEEAEPERMDPNVSHVGRTLRRPGGGLVDEWFAAEGHEGRFSTLSSPLLDMRSFNFPVAPLDSSPLRIDARKVLEVQFSEAQNQAITRLQELGFDRTTSARAYLECHLDEEAAGNRLLS